jgi:hypothetical protein
MIGITNDTRAGFLGGFSCQRNVLKVTAAALVVLGVHVVNHLVSEQGSESAANLQAVVQWNASNLSQALLNLSSSFHDLMS